MTLVMTRGDENPSFTTPHVCKKCDLCIIFALIVFLLAFPISVDCIFLFLIDCTITPGTADSSP